MCTISTDVIYLTWRKDIKKERHIIGKLCRNNGRYSFSYIQENIKYLNENGVFLPYPAFPELNEVYAENVLEIFGRRLLNPQRRDYEDFLTYWGANNYKNDTFALLGLTGAKLLTDNFEFIAPHTEIPASFNTDVSWLNTNSEYVVNEIRRLSNNEVEQKIKLVLDTNNEFDKKAVKVMFENEKLGFLKSIHCENVHDAIVSGKTVKTRIANIIKNGTIKEVLLRINIDN